MALAKAASIGLQRISEAATVAMGSPRWVRAKRRANWPARRCDPEIMAAIVSSVCCLVFSITSSGKVRSPASLMYALSLAITGLTSCAINFARPGNAAAAMAHPACCNRLRRVRFVPSQFTEILAFRSVRIWFLYRASIYAVFKVLGLWGETDSNTHPM